ncbi:Septum site-determining protein OS=Streptomyces glaucescens OX=1907 GN=SGLAU_21550 PE=4 SV=1 [Streptomyces glaucescens]
MALEYLGFIPILVLVALAAVQLGLIAYAARQGHRGPRRSPQRLPGRALHGGLPGRGQRVAAGGTSCTSAGGGDEVEVTATVDIPSVVPGFDFGDAHKSATMPRDHGPRSTEP